ncbi:carbohydrate esterase family 4 protein [Coleophoma crateriformis]|uniref:chitin deacetylase n=1 Tax=Coleophoma crateriformis TaxID=565419 RepID=A0A3D8SM68_9HELO|nr:carbohydrate esterase family 4 protein [Coleophoma crateriformis]
MAFTALLILLALILVFLLVIYYPPKLLFDFMQWKHPGVLFHVPLPPTHRTVALTLDDCPSSSTSTMLDSLKKYNCKATFFIIGDQIPGYEHIVQRIHDEGHEVGNHAWTDEKTVLRPLPEIERQIKAVDALLPTNSNGLKYFRPGGGFFSNKMVEMVTGLGYKVILGCVYPHDPQIWSAWVNSRHVLSMVRPGGIIIMHDRRLHSAPQLELVLEGLTAKGWEVVSLGKMLDIAGKVNGKKSG